MKVLLIDIDSKIPNLALMKLSAWHKAKGDKIIFNYWLEACDKQYASCIFSWNGKLLEQIPFPKIEVGGPGIDLQGSLPQEVDSMMPDYSLYPNSDYSLGYTYRGCPRRCPFCVVPKMPQDQSHHSIYEFWNRKHRKIRLLNNNTFADADWKKTFEELITEKLVLIEEGFDIRLLDDEMAFYLKRVKFEKQIHFAFDNMADEPAVKMGISILREAGIAPRKLMFYVLCGFNTSQEQDLYRVLLLRDLGVDPFVMIYRNHEKPTRALKDFARWVNHKAIFKSVKFEDYKKRIGAQLPLLRR